MKYYRDGKWSKPIEVTGPNEDLVGCAIAADGSGTVWTVYSANRNGSHRIYARSVNGSMSGKEQLLSRFPGKELNPAACTAQTGWIQVAHQHRSDDGSSLAWFYRDEKQWHDEGIQVGSRVWTTAVSAGSENQVQMAFDNMLLGDYDLSTETTIAEKNHFGDTSVCGSGQFEARPSIAYDPAGRLWIAYEEGPEQWGKDYGALAADKGQPLYSSRSVRVVCLEKGKLFKPVAELPTSNVPVPKIPYGGGIANKYEKLPRYAYPKIGIDGKGRVWLTYRQKFGTPL